MLERYELSSRALGYSQSTITIVKISAGKFDAFLGGIPDVRKVSADDFRRFLVFL